MPATGVDAGTVVAQTSPDGSRCAPSPCTAPRAAARDTCIAILGIARGNTLLHTRRCQRGASQAAGISVNNREQPTRLGINTIQPIPVDQRHGTSKDLFTVWFGSNLMLLTIVTGGVPGTVFALPFAWGVSGAAGGARRGESRGCRVHGAACGSRADARRAANDSDARSVRLLGFAARHRHRHRDVCRIPSFQPGA